MCSLPILHSQAPSSGDLQREWSTQSFQEQCLQHCICPILNEQAPGRHSWEWGGMALGGLMAKGRGLIATSWKSEENCKQNAAQYSMTSEDPEYFSVSLPTYTSFTHTFLFLNQGVVTSLLRKRTRQATGVGCRRYDWLTAGAAGPSQAILPACHTKYPWKKSPMLGCTNGCQVVPQLLPRCFCTYKIMCANSKSENWSDRALEQPKNHNAPPRAPWKSFLHMLFGKMMIPCCVMAGLCRETIKGEDEFELKEGSLDQFSRIVQVAHRQDNVNS